MSTTGTPQIKQLWELFVQAAASSYEKSSWLDLFLAEFLVRIRNGSSIQELLSFWPAGEAGVATLVGCELLGAVHQAFSVPGQTEELRPLKELLLHGLGWRCLAVLHCLSLEGICCARELSSLLISLYPVCVKAASEAHTADVLETANESKTKKTNPFVKARLTDVDCALQMCLSLKMHGKSHTPQRKHSLCPPVQHDFVGPGRYSPSFSSRSRRTKSIKESSISGNTPTSDSDQEDQSLEVLNRSLTLKIHLNPMDFDYFTSVVRSDEESHLDSALYESHRKRNRKKISQDNFLNDELNAVLKSEINQYEFSILVIQILQNLCASEVHVSTDMNPPISVQSLNFALENLCSLQFGSALTKALSNVEIAELKSAFTQLILVSLDKVIRLPDVTMTVINNGILPLMLRILEDTTCKLAFLRKNPCEDETSDGASHEFENLITPETAPKVQELVFGIMYGVISFLYYQLVQRSSIDKFRDFMELFKLFSDSQGGRLIEKTLAVILSIPHINANASINRVKKIIDFIGQLIGALKKVRSEIIHSHQCNKTRHKQCRSSVALSKHHHQDLFGAVYSSMLVPSSAHQSCCISFLFMTLVQLLDSHQINANADLQIRLVKIMIICGTCCCFPAKKLLATLSQLFKSTTGKIRPLGFVLLERTLYSELGAVPVDDKSQCVICNKHSCTDYASMKYFTSGEYSADESFSESLWSRTNVENKATSSYYNDSSSEQSNEKNSWHFLEQYNSLINSTDLKLSYATTSHLLKVAPRCTARVSYELLFRVFYPTFLAAKTQYSKNQSDHAKFKILTSLSLFASLLGNVPFAEQFVNLGGLNHITDLINDPDFSKACCSVLEITVIIEIWKLECEIREQNITKHTSTETRVSPVFNFAGNAQQMKEIPSLDMLMNALEGTTKDILKYLRISKASQDSMSCSDTLNESTPERPKQSPSETDTSECLDSSLQDDNSAKPSCEIVKDENTQPEISELKKEQESVAEKTDNDSELQDIEKDYQTDRTISESESRFETALDISLDKGSEKYLQLLHNGSVFWKSCASLCLYSPQLRQHISSEPVSIYSDEMLWALLDELKECKDMSSQHFCKETRLHVKLLEAVLTVNLVTLTSREQFDKLCTSLRKKILSHDATNPVRPHYITELYEVLLRCATLRPSPDQVMPPHSKPKMPPVSSSGPGPIRWEDEAPLGSVFGRGLEFSDSSLADAAAYATADEGYEADVEILPEKRSDTYSRFDTTNSMVDSCSSGGSVTNLAVCDLAIVPSMLYAEYSRGDSIVHPSLCLLALDLLVNLNASDEKKTLSDVLLCLQRLLALCRDSAYNCIALAYTGATSLLLDGFRLILETRNNIYIEVQKTILELASLLSMHSINGNELSAYLRLFKARQPPLSLLLEPLVTLAAASGRPQPYHILSFPPDTVNSSEPIYVVNDITGGDDAAMAMANMFRLQHLGSDHSPWSNYAVCLPINTEVGWSMWHHGFSYCLWLRLERPGAVYAPGSKKSGVQSRLTSIEESDQWEHNTSPVQQPKNLRSSGKNETTVMHLMSIGNEALLVEMWADSSNDSLIFRLTRPDSKNNKIISERSVEGCLPSSQWHHLALNVRDNIEKRKINVEITLLINGWREVSLQLPLNGLLIRKCRPTCVLLGQTRLQSNSPRGSWFFGNLMMFRCPVFTKERAIYLVGLGPNYTSLTECEVGKHIPNFTSIFGPRTISNIIDWDSILDAAGGNLKELQDNLLLTYTAQNSNLINVYPQLISNPGGVVSHLFPTQPGFRVVTSDQRGGACQQLPLALSPGLVAPLAPQHYRGLATAAAILGGTPIFLVLFARVVELDSTEAEQGMALRLLLRLVQADSALHTQFLQHDGYQLLLRVFASQRCKQSQHILKAILDTCCDKPVLHHNSLNDTFTIINQTDAIIVSGFTVRAALDGAVGPKLIGPLLNALHALLRDEHPFREFNAAQLNRVHLVEALLMFCKERFVYGDNTFCDIPSSVCCSLVELIRSLMGAPPEFCHIVAVADFLLLVHQASATYVTHVRSSFYFMLNAAPPVGQNANNPLSLPLMEESPFLQSGSSSISGVTQAIDPRKLNKALANLKIQQGRLDTSKKSRKVRRKGRHEIDSNLIRSNVPDSGISGSYRDHTSGESSIKSLHFDALNTPGSSVKDSSAVVLANENALSSVDASSTISSKDGELIENPSDCNIEIVENSENLNANLLNTFLKNFTISSSADNVPENDETQPKMDEVDGASMSGNFSVENTENPSSKNEKSPRVRSKLSEQIRCGRNMNEKETEKESQSHWLIVEGLLLLLRDTLLVLPDTMASQVLSLVVKPDVLLVMANHPAASVRTALVKVLSAYIQRSTDEEVNKLIKSKYFFHLANQLSLFSTSRDLAGACCALVTKCSAPLEEQAELTPWSELTVQQLQALPPVLAILPKTLHDAELTHHILTFITQIFSKANYALKTMLECGLIEILLRTLLEVCQSPFDSPIQSLLPDLVALLVSIASRCLSTTGAHNMQVVTDIHNQLSYLALRERSSDQNSASSGAGEGSIRAIQCAVFDGMLDSLQERLSICQQPPGFKLRTTTSYLASVLSSSYEPNEAPSNSSIKGPGRAHRLHSIDIIPGLPGTLGQLLGVPQTRELPRAEVCDRFKTIIVKCIDFLVNIEPVGGCYAPASIAETKLVRRIFLTLLQGLSSSPTRSSGTMSSVSAAIPWRSAVWGARGALRQPMSNLLLWLLTPGQPIKLRMFAVHSLREEVNCKDLLTSLLQTHAQAEQKFTVYLWHLMYCSGSTVSGSVSSESDTPESVKQSPGLSAAELRACEDLKEALQCWGVVSPHSVGHAHDKWHDELETLADDCRLQRKRWMTQFCRSVYRSVYKWESLSRTLTDTAMSITRDVVEAQNRERKTFMGYVKRAYSDRLGARLRWQRLVQQLTHERAVWHFSESYPRSWQLDPTEGPLRVRKRLQRCHLNLEKRFLMSDHQYKLDYSKRIPPLTYLLEENSGVETASSLLVERLHTSEKVRHMCSAHVVMPAFDLPGELLIGDTCLHFVPEDALHLPQVLLSGQDLSSMAWHFENIREIHNRRFQLQERALEIFLTNGKTYLVAFPTSKDRDTFTSELAHCHLPNRVHVDYLGDAVQLWREGLITNWEYIMQLNKMAGRSYNDLMQYPVFPFVIADYVSDVLDLNDPGIYRNLKRPMAVQDKKNEEHYVKNYNYLKQLLNEGMNVMALNQEPYHYGSHYSNSGTVLHFLVRLPPFTRMFLQYQDNNFDIPDRTFHALCTTWRLTSCDSTTDVKELIPEFFYLPEFLENNEGFNLGVRQNGERVNHVQLPTWAQNNARTFTLVHRQALESDHVRENLPHWIDLVFGYKQTGKAAVEAINVFHPATYYGFNVEAISDPLERTASETMVKTYGQTPCQLFRSPHPMVVQPLTNVTAYQTPDVIDGVKGLRWGTFVGSPSQPAPVIAWRHKHRHPVATLIPLITEDVYGLSPHTSILLNYNKERGLSLINTTSVFGVALVTWRHSDNIVRVKLKKEHPPWPLVQSPSLDPMCACASVPDWSQLWLGQQSGTLRVYTYSLWPARGHLEMRPEPAVLLGHQGAVTAIALCPSYSIAVSGSIDGAAVLWDLNNLSYVRSLDSSEMPISLICISETLGDIAIVYEKCVQDMVLREQDVYEAKPDEDMTGSVLRVFTINCALIGDVVTKSNERITSICYSAAPEGVSVNVLAAGLSTGVVRLYSSWNLASVREISCSHVTSPVISITFSHDSQHLFVSASDGTVVIWENPNGPGRTPKFLNLTSL